MNSDEAGGGKGGGSVAGFFEILVPRNIYRILFNRLLQHPGCVSIQILHTESAGCL